MIAEKWSSSGRELPKYEPNPPVNDVEEVVNNNSDPPLDDIEVKEEIDDDVDLEEIEDEMNCQVKRT